MAQLSNLAEAQEILLLISIFSYFISHLIISIGPNAMDFVKPMDLDLSGASELVRAFS